jgi:Tfp pilus assembly protein PilX
MPRIEKGIALFLVLSLIMVGAVLAGIIMNITLSHFELTRHKAHRIKAYYAALAGMNLAFEQLRVNNTSWTGNYNLTLCNQDSCNVTDPDIPYPVAINITKTDAVNYIVNITVNYTTTSTFRGRI